MTRLMMKGLVAIALALIPLACNSNDTAVVTPETSQAPAAADGSADVSQTPVEPTPVEPTPSAADQVPVAPEVSSSFVTADAGHPTQGDLTVVEENSQLYLEFASNFQTVDGPDVKVLLHRSETVPVAINEADYVSIAPLESVSGEQRYLIPTDINLEDFKSAAIWCAKFNVTFGYATL